MSEIAHSLSTERVVIVIDAASRPGVGKTALLATLLENMMESLGDRAKNVTIHPNHGSLELHHKTMEAQNRGDYDLSKMGISIEVFHSESW